jgi:hypothetical protein
MTYDHTDSALLMGTRDGRYDLERWTFNLNCTPDPEWRERYDAAYDNAKEKSR